MSREIIAILRGVTPDEAIPIADALVEAGITRIEVPLNSPDPFDSIGKMLEAHGNRAMIGAGTVLDVQAVERLHEMGAIWLFHRMPMHPSSWRRSRRA